MNPRFHEISIQDPRLKSILYQGYLKDDQGHELLALPREIVQAGGMDARLILELRDKSSVRSGARGIAFWLQTLRAISLTATATPGLAVLLYGLLQEWYLDAGHFVLALLGALLFQVAINLWNDIYDHLRLIDLPGTGGGSGILHQGALSAATLNRIAWGSFVVGGACGLPVLLAHPQLMALVALGAVVGTLGYSGPPFNFKYKALGDLTVFLLCGPLLTTGFALAAFDRVDSGTQLLGAFFGMAAVGILHSNNVQDIPVDTRRGARTLASLVGFMKARHGLWLVYGFCAMCLIGLFVAQKISWATLLVPALALPLLVPICLNSSRASGPDSALLGGIRIKTAQAHLILGLLVCVGLIVDRWLGL